MLREKIQKKTWKLKNLTKKIKKPKILQKKKKKKIES